MSKLRSLLQKGRLEEAFKDKKPRYSAAEAKVEADRCLYCTDAPCIQACPTEINIPGFIKQIASGNVRGSAKTIFEQNLLGASCARVCPVEVLCQGSCVYEAWGREPIAIGRLQRFATETATAVGQRALLKPRKKSGKKVACVGAGAASLAFAGYMALEGHEAVVFEKRAIPGGLNAWGIAPYKLSTADALEEVEWLQTLGVKLELGKAVGDAGLTGPELLKQYDAVFIGVGLGADSNLGVPGEDGAGVVGATAWIEKMKTDAKTAKPTGRVLVVGGGNTAIDVARECAVLGSPEVTMVYRRGEADMSGYAHELDAARVDGVRVMTESVPVAFVHDAKGTLVAAKVAKTKGGKPVAGSEVEVPCDLAVVAIGQAKLGALAKQFDGVTVDAKGLVEVDAATCATKNPKVFAGGDCINGGKEVVNAVADGRNAARFLSSKWSS